LFARSNTNDAGQKFGDVNVDDGNDLGKNKLILGRNVSEISWRKKEIHVRPPRSRPLATIRGTIRT